MKKTPITPEQARAVHAEELTLFFKRPVAKLSDAQVASWIAQTGALPPPPDASAAPVHPDRPPKPTHQ